MAERMHQGGDVAASRIAAIASGLVAVLILVALAAWGAMALFAGRREGIAEPAAAPPRIAPPRLQSVPGLELHAFRSEKEALVNGYRWLDRDRGIARIPVQRAMAILAARGQNGNRQARDAEKQGKRKTTRSDTRRSSGK